MKAIVLEKNGPAENLKLAEVPTPEPKKNEVLIRLKATGINHVDIWVRQGGPAYPVSLPHILGADGSGVVEKMGEEAEGVTPGERVLILPAIFCGECQFCKKGQTNQCVNFEILGTKRNGTYAEYVCVPDQNVIPIPDSLSFEQTAAFPLAYLTAWHMLMGRAKLQPKEKVLIVGASAGIAVAAIQIAKAHKAEVYAATSTPSKTDKIKALGADHIYSGQNEQDLSTWVQKMTDGAGVDVVFEHVGPATWEQSMKSLTKYGRLVTCGATTGPKVDLDLRSLYGRDISILGARMGTEREFLDLTGEVFSGKLKPVIDKAFPLSEAAQAHAYLEAKNQFGKVLLKTA